MARRTCGVGLGMSGWVMLVLVFQMGDLSLPNEMFSVSDLVRTSDGYAIWDAAAETVFLLSLDGQILKQYDRRGFGPGEFQKIFKIRFHENHYYLVDLMRRSVLIFDERLEFIKEWQTQGLPRDVWVLKDAIFLVYWDSRSQKMVHKMASSGHVSTSFGTGLDHERLLGFQSGQLLEYQGLLYFIHHFIPALKIFDLEGALIKSIPLPGFDEEEPFVNLDRLLGPAKPFTMVMQDLFFVMHFIMIKLRDLETRRAWTYVFDPKLGEFVRKVGCPWETVSDQGGGFFQIVRDEDGMPVKLKSLLIKE